jgi:hypothetical protein
MWSPWSKRATDSLPRRTARMQRKIEYTINFRNKTPIEDGGDRYTLEDFKDRITEMMKQAGRDSSGSRRSG